LLRLVAGGYTNSQIGSRLGISEGTVRKHLENIYGRLQVSSRTAAVTRAFRDLPAFDSAGTWGSMASSGAASRADTDLENRPTAAFDRADYRIHGRRPVLSAP
jgi:hypothetical protein